jgi:pyruvyl transferase EpsO
MARSSTYSLSNVRSAIDHYLLGRGTAAVAGFVSAILLVRHMDIPSYAAYIAFFGVAGIAGLLSSLGLERVITRFVPEGRLFHDAVPLRRFINRLLGIQFLATLLVALLLALAWKTLVSLFDFVAADDVPPALILYVIATALAATLSTALQALLRQKLLTGATVIQWSLRLGWILALALQSDGNITLAQALWIMALPELGLALALAVALALTLRSMTDAHDPLANKGTEEWPNLGEVSALAGHSFTFNLLAAPPQGYFMRTIVAATLPAETVAAFGFFSNLLDRIRAYLPMQLMYNLIEPVLVARYLEDRDEQSLTRSIGLMYKTNLLIIVMALLFLAIGGQSAVSLLTAGKYVEQTWILSLLIVQIAMGSHVLAIQLVVNVLKKNQILSFSAAVALTVMLSFLAISLVGTQPMLVLFGTLVYSITMNTTAFLLLARSRIAYRPPFKDAAKLVAIGVGLALLINYVVFALGAPGSRTLEVLVACGAAILLAAITMKCSYASAQEIGMLQKLLRTRGAN